MRRTTAAETRWRVKPGTVPVLRGGGVFGVERLDLEWHSGKAGQNPGFVR